MTNYRRLSLVLGPVLLVSVAYCATVSEEPDPIPADWVRAVLIGNEQESFRPHVAMDPDGNAVAVWDEDELRDTHEDIWSSRYTPTGEWSAPIRIRDTEGAATYGRVAMDSEGNAVVVWHESERTETPDEEKTFSIWSNRYTSSAEAWVGAQLIEFDDVGSALFPQVAMNAEGTAVAVWHQGENIWSNRYTPSTGTWDGAEPIDQGGGNSALHPQVAIDAEGNAVAVWHEYDGTRFNIRSNRYQANRWGTAEPIETDNDGNAKFPQVAMDAEGNAVAVWHQFDGTRDSIWFSRYQANRWGTAEPIETDDDGNAKFPQVAVDAQGNAVVVWERSHGTSVDIWSNRYTPGGGWRSPERIEANKGGSLKPKVAVDAEGNAVAVWTQYEGGTSDNDNVWSNHYDAATARWGIAQAIDEYDEGNAWTPQVAMNPDGDAIAVWVQGEAVTGQIWSNRLQRP
jgi:uncharacterized protein YheU (UPF0270 family)